MRCILFLTILFFASCTTARLPVAEEFSNQASKMQVKGMNGWMVNQKLTFGNYTTSAIKRGWDFKGSVQYTKFKISPEEAVAKVFNINTENKNDFQKNKFQYTIQDNNVAAEVYATEKFTEKQLVYKSNNPWIGNASKTTRYDYSFTAVIVPLTTNNNDPWSLVLINKYDIAKNKGHLQQPYIEEEGYATNGKNSIAVRPLRIDSVGGTTRTTKILGGRLLAGYELQSNGKAVAVIDILDNTIWLHNQLESSEKLVLSSISSAILLKRMQDIQKDKDDFDN